MWEDLTAYNVHNFKELIQYTKSIQETVKILFNYKVVFLLFLNISLSIT